MPPEPSVEFGVSEFVAVFNQTLEYAYQGVVIVGELANFRISKNRWVYFDLKDELATVKFFANVTQLPGPLEEGMVLKVRGQPRLHNLYGFSVNVLSMQPVGEGSIRRAADLLRAKLTTEGLFDEARKRRLPYPPQRIGLITSTQSAAYADFIKILRARWPSIAVEVIDVQVQGEVAPAQIAAAIKQCNAQAEPPEVLVIIRGGGSAEDLAAFSTELVTRAVAASRVPTLVAIGHEIDTSLAELAADRRASTPSNAAELLVPDRGAARQQLAVSKRQLAHLAAGQVRGAQQRQLQRVHDLHERISGRLSSERQRIQATSQLLAALNPQAILERGYAIVRADGKVVRVSSQVAVGAIVEVELAKSRFSATVNRSTDGKKD